MKSASWIIGRPIWTLIVIIAAFFIVVGTRDVIAEVESCPGSSDGTLFTNIQGAYNNTGNQVGATVYWDDPYASNPNAEATITWTAYEPGGAVSDTVPWFSDDRNKGLFPYSIRVNDAPAWTDMTISVSVTAPGEPILTDDTGTEPNCQNQG